MRVKIQSIHFDADQKLLDFVELKVGKLNTYSNAIIDGEVYLRLDKSASHENKIAELNYWFLEMTFSQSANAKLSKKLLIKQLKL